MWSNNQQRVHPKRDGTRADTDDEPPECGVSVVGYLFRTGLVVVEGVLLLITLGRSKNGGRSSSKRIRKSGPSRKGKS